MRASGVGGCRGRQGGHRRQLAVAEGGEAERHDLHRLVRRGVAIDGSCSAQELGAQRLGVQRRAVRRRHRQLEVLADVAHVEGPGQSPPRRRHVLAREPGGRLAFEVFESLRQLGFGHGVQERHAGADQVAAAAARPAAPARRGCRVRAAPGPARCRDRARASPACSGPAPPKATSVKPRGSCPRSTETTRMAPAMLRGDRDDAARRLDGRGPSSVGQARDRPLGQRRGRRPCAPPSSCVGLEPAEHDVGVGHGRRGAAAAVAGGAGIRAGALRPDAQRAAGVDPGDAAAAGADRVDVEASGRAPGSPRSSRSGAELGGRPPRSATSVDVPPMSKVMIESIPAAALTHGAPITPAAGAGQQRAHRLLARRRRRR